MVWLRDVPPAWMLFASSKSNLLLRGTTQSGQEIVVSSASSSQETGRHKRPLRIGAVSYLNARPLVAALPRLAPDALLAIDLPSRLADDLAADRLDVALIPSIEYFRGSDYAIVSDACVACDGPVRSVKLFGRVPPEQINTLALDEGSRTSAALARILLKRKYDIEPELVPLAVGQTVEATAADAVLLIGDRAMAPRREEFAFTWDLGAAWRRWTGLPFVFAMWIAREGVEGAALGRLLARARDEGQRQLEMIARNEAEGVGIPEAECLAYLRENLVFRLDDRQRQGLQQFYRLAVEHGLAPEGVRFVFQDPQAA